jgi:tetratricopeptide (TPR) repeat protein
MGHSKATDPLMPAQLFARATQAHQQGRLDIAAALYQQLLAVQADHAEAHHLLGVILGQQGDYAAAAHHIQRALTLAPYNPIYHNNLGEVWRRAQRLPEAAEAYRRAIQLQPGFAQAHYHLGNVLKLLGELDEAIAHYQQALQQRPDQVEVHYNLGNAYLEQGRYKSAMACYEKAIQLNPNHPEAHNNLGVTRREWDQFDEALACFQRALALQPTFREARLNLGLLLEAQGRTEEARRCYQPLLTPDPAQDLFRLHVDTLAPVIFPSNEAIDDYRHRLAVTLADYATRDLQVDLTRLHQSGGEPPSLLYQGRDDRPLKMAYAQLFRDRFPQYPRSLGRDRPHLGFVVTHGHEGVFLKCLRGILNHLPGQRFRLTVVCSRPNGEAILRPLITNPAVAYLSLPARFDQALALVQEACFDLLYYWEVGTDTLNYFLPFCRLAPVQCTSWGWPVTSGIPQLDYFISCAGLETAESEAHYSETLFRLQRLSTYYYRPPLPTVLKPREHFGLRTADHVYLCAQNLRKVHPDCDPLFADILRRDPRGVVVLIADKQPAITRLLKQRLQGHDAEVAERIHILPRMSESDYLNLTALADVVLDTLHYGGGANTLYDAFAAGTPVVTWPGRFHRSRYAYAAYQQMGVLDGIASSAPAYVDLALRLANEPDYRAAMSARIRDACPTLFEDQQAVTELADCFEALLAAKAA